MSSVAVKACERPMISKHVLATITMMMLVTVAVMLMVVLVVMVVVIPAEPA